MDAALLCLDISQEVLAAVTVQHSGKVTMVNACTSCETAGRPPAEALADLLEGVVKVPNRVLLSFGAEFFSFRNLKLPFAGKKRIAQVLPFELADQMPLPTEELLYDFLFAASGPGESEVIAAMLPRQLVLDCLEVLKQSGYAVESVGLAGLATAGLMIGEVEEPFLLLDCAGSWANLFWVNQASLCLIRSLPVPEAGARAQQYREEFFPNLKRTLLAAAPVEPGTTIRQVVVLGSHSRSNGLRQALTTALPQCLPQAFRVSSQPLVKFMAGVRADYRPELMDRALALGLKRGPKALRLELLQGDLRGSRFSGRQRQIIRLSGLILLLGLVFIFGYLGWDYSAKLARQEQLDQEIRVIFRETIPEATRIVQPVQQLQVINNEMRRAYRPGGDSITGYTVIQLLTELSARIPGSLEVRITRLVADTETVRLRGVTKDFNTVDIVQRELEKAPLFKGVTISSASQSLADDEIRFELKISLAAR